MRARAFLASAVLSLTALSLVRCATPDEADYVGGEPASSDATSNDVNTSSDAIADGADVTDAGVDAASLCVGAHQQFNTATGHCYQFTLANPNGEVWATAESECVVLGGHLVAIDNLSEQLFVAQFVTDELVGVDAASYSTFWMGLNNLDSSTGPLTYRWSNGDNLTFTNWASTSPAGKPCVVQYTEGNTKAKTTWDDFQCDVESSFVCEF